MKKLIAAMLLAAPMMASAASGELCMASLTQAKPMNRDAVTNETTFDCHTAGKGLTIPELYQKGWRVASVFPQMAQDPSTGLPRSQWTLVIEKL